MQGWPPVSEDDRLKGGDKDMAQMLTAKQVAEVKGCSYQYVKRILQEGKLQAIETVNSRNRKIYQIPLEALPEELQQRWYQMQKEQMAEGAVPADQEPEQEQPDRYSEAERKENVVRPGN